MADTIVGWDVELRQWLKPFLDRLGHNQDYVDALKMQLAIGARIGEIAGLHANEIDNETWLWTCRPRAKKNGRPRVTPLVGLAREIAEARLRETKDAALFHADNSEVLTSNCVSSFIVKHRKKIPVGHFTSHDLRRTVATGLIDLGFSFDVVAAVLGHEAGTSEPIRHYIRSDLVDRKRKALEAWDSRIRQILRGETPPANVANLALQREQIVA